MLLLEISNNNNNNNKTQQNSRCRLCVDQEEMSYYISECSKLAQEEYKTRYDWVGKVIHRKLCKKLKLDHSKKWYMHNPSWKMRCMNFSWILRYKQIT